jgi:hypothetical protein
VPWYAKVTQDPLTSQRLKEDQDRPKYNSKAAEYGTDGVRGRLRVGNQIVERKAHDEEDDEPLDPRHVGLLMRALNARLFEHLAACTGSRACVLVLLTRAKFWALEPVASRHRTRAGSTGQDDQRQCLELVVFGLRLKQLGYLRLSLGLPCLL